MANDASLSYLYLYKRETPREPEPKKPPALSSDGFAVSLAILPANERK